MNRVDPNLDESDQMFRQGAQGIQGSTAANPNACIANTSTPLACVNIGDIEQLPQSGLATPSACATNGEPADVMYMLCGIESRLDTNYAGLCQNITDFSTLSASYLADTDGAYYTDYSGYSGNGRRIVTVAIVTPTLPTDTTCSAAMTVLGFRQFLVEPPADGTGTFSATDPNGRIPVLYLGTVAPIAQGWFDSRFAPACSAAGTVAGPGKVVLHQ
jgi:hypothetical protein